VTTDHEQCTLDQLAEQLLAELLRRGWTEADARFRAREHR
jgi:hypothetical protein